MTFQRLSSAEAPATVAAMLKATEAVEAEQAKVGAPGASAQAVQDEESTFDPLQDLTERFKELVAAIEFRRRKPFDKSKVRFKTNVLSLDIPVAHLHPLQEPDQ